MNNIQVLETLKLVAEELNSNPKPLSKDFWLSQDKLLEESYLENEKLKKALTMSPEKYRQPFTL